MFGNAYRYFIFLLVVMYGCNTKHTEKNNVETVKDELLLPNDISLVSVGLHEVKFYKEYDFVLVYLDQKRFGLTTIFTMALADSILYSTTKYLNNVVSSYYPPVLNRDDSFYYSTTFKEYSLEVKDEIFGEVVNSNFYNEKLSTETLDNHKSSWLFIYEKNKGTKSLVNWPAESKVEQQLIRFIKEHYMNFSLPDLEKKIFIEDEDFKQVFPNI